MGKLSARRVRGNDAGTVAKNTRRALDQLTKQANSGTSVFGVLGSNLPTGMKGGDIAMRPVDGTSIEVSIADDRGNLLTIPLRSGVSNGMTLTTSTGAPTTAQLPSNGDSGFHKNTSTNGIYVALNIGGTVVFPTLSLFSGDLPFSRISGSFTDTLHGNRGGGTLHDVATSGTAGFMSAADKTKLDTYPATSTTAVTASTGVERDAGGAINATGYEVSGAPVVGARKASVATVTETATGVYGANEQTMLDNLKTAVNTLIARLNTSTGHGLISG